MKAKDILSLWDAHFGKLAEAVVGTEINPEQFNDFMFAHNIADPKSPKQILDSRRSVIRKQLSTYLNRKLKVDRRLVAPDRKTSTTFITDWTGQPKELVAGAARRAELVIVKHERNIKSGLRKLLEEDVEGCIGEEFLELATGSILKAYRNQRKEMAQVKHDFSALELEISVLKLRVQRYEEALGKLSRGSEDVMTALRDIQETQQTLDVPNLHVIPGGKKGSSSV